MQAQKIHFIKNSSFLSLTLTLALALALALALLPVLLKHLRKRSARFLQCFAKHLDFVFFQVERRGGVLHFLTLMRHGKILGALQRRMEHNKCVTCVAFELQQHEIIAGESHRCHIHRDALAALGAAHLLLDPLDDELKRVRVKFH